MRPPASPTNAATAPRPRRGDEPDGLHQHVAALGPGPVRGTVIRLPPGARVRADPVLADAVVYDEQGFPFLHDLNGHFLASGAGASPGSVLGGFLETGRPRMDGHAARRRGVVLLRRAGPRRGRDGGGAGVVGGRAVLPRIVPPRADGRLPVLVPAASRPRPDGGAGRGSARFAQRLRRPARTLGPVPGRAVRQAVHGLCRPGARVGRRLAAWPHLARLRHPGRPEPLRRVAREPRVARAHPPLRGRADRQCELGDVARARRASGDALVRRIRVGAGDVDGFHRPERRADRVRRDGPCSGATAGG